MKVDITETKNERQGLTTTEAEEAYKKWGYNELPVVEVPLWYVFLKQFTGVMPYTMEICVVVAAGCQSWPDFGIIIAMLIINAILGFREELNSARALAELTNKMEKRVATLRDGKVEHLATRLLVPGDVVLLVGGVEVPADIDWIEGDVLSIDTAALTGEPIPRKYPSDLHGTLILSGTTVRAGEAYGVVRKTGINTEIGSAQSEIMKDKSSARSAVFEDRVVQIVQFVIVVTLVDVFVIFFVQGFATGLFYDGQTSDVFLACLGIVIASVPTALPLLWQITMSLGSTKMAREFSCVVTSQAALLDISCMTVLCSDKTGTLTTARISINADQVWLCGDFTKADLALYAGLSSSRDKTEDAIDRSVVSYVDRIFGKEQAMATESQYTKSRAVGFNPIYKRVLFEFTHPTKGKITVVKGLPNKILDTEDGGSDDAADQWKCDKCEELKPIIKKIDFNFSKAGYKTLGVAVKINDGPFQYVGILPMLDPPRHDTAETLRNLQNAGIEVKMITGDHLNIARETARLIGLGQNIHAGADIRADEVPGGGAHHHHAHEHGAEASAHPSNAKNADPNADIEAPVKVPVDRATEIAELIHKANGFAQVLPKDKREVVVTLKEKYGYVVGMTGDGVNDAPALSAAQCGIAVDDATDAAKNAAAIILTTPGLSAIYGYVQTLFNISRNYNLN